MWWLTKALYPSAAVPALPSHCRTHCGPISQTRWQPRPPHSPTAWSTLCFTRWALSHLFGFFKNYYLAFEWAGNSAETVLFMCSRFTRCLQTADSWVTLVAQDQLTCLQTVVLLAETTSPSRLKVKRLQRPDGFLHFLLIHCRRKNVWLLLWSLVGQRWNQTVEIKHKLFILM